MGKPLDPFVAPVWIDQDFRVLQRLKESLTTRRREASRVAGLDDIEDQLLAEQFPEAMKVFQF